MTPAMCPVEIRKAVHFVEAKSMPYKCSEAKLSLSEWRKNAQMADTFSREGKESVIFSAYFFGVIKNVSIFAACFVP